jgi:hypothetical protein
VRHYPSAQKRVFSAVLNMLQQRASPVQTATARGSRTCARAWAGPQRGITPRTRRGALTLGCASTQSTPVSTRLRRDACPDGSRTNCGPGCAQERPRFLANASRHLGKQETRRTGLQHDPERKSTPRARKHAPGGARADVFGLLDPTRVVRRPVSRLATRHDVELRTGMGWAAHEHAY